ncbi:MAG TPA: hypothetical protein DCM05_02370 [Elusimicrobia bacterium]|nr:hypothetical protein [Elusimicrobiota bacterium]
MLAECPKCRHRYEADRSLNETEIACSCGERIRILPWLAYRRIVSERKRMSCPTCGREYDLAAFRADTEVACGCGGLIVAKLSSRTGQAIGRRRNDHAHRFLLAELRGLVDTSRLIHSASQDLDKLLPTVIRIAGEMLDVGGATIALWDKGARELVFQFVVTEGGASKLASFRLAEGEGIVGDCVSKRLAVIVNNPLQDPRFSKKADEESGFLTHSILCVPLIVDSQCIGALELVNKNGGEGFSRHDLALAEAVAGQIAVAIHNAQLIRESLKAARLAAIGEAVAGVAHCIKNMLNGLSGGMYLLKSAVKKAGSDIPGRSIGMIDRNLELLKNLVQDMLTYAKERRPEYQACDLNEVVKGVVDLMAPKAHERGVPLRFEPTPGPNPVELDGQGICRCVLNLVTNALDACEGREGAGVDVRVRELDCGEVAVDVADQGCGMDEAARGSLFKAFFSTKGSKGTGLGLSVTRKIVQEHGGRIEVDTALGRGTTFSLRLPRSRQAAMDAGRQGG